MDFMLIPRLGYVRVNVIGGGAVQARRSAMPSTVTREKLRYADRFDDPNLTGSMEVTISFRKVSVGTEL
jgi:hypothetical protein